MKNYKIVLQYEGTKYSGWQTQGNTNNTIQGKLEAILEKMTGVPVEVHGSGRTDAGAHARGQVANFKIKTNKTKEEIQEYLNEYLPKDISVFEIEAVPMQFHSRLNATAKTYVYRIWNSAVPNVFDRREVCVCPQKLNIEQMQKAASYLVGEHDFKSFCANQRIKKATIRTIYKIDIQKEGDEIRFILRGDGFLYNMVRIIIGTLLDVGEEKRRPEEILNILEAKKREAAGATMPAHGLTLLKVEY